MVDTLELAKQVSATGRRAGGREGRRALRAKAVPSFPALVRKIPVYEIVPDEAIELVHEELVRILEEIGCEFRDPEARGDLEGGRRRCPGLPGPHRPRDADGARRARFRAEFTLSMRATRSARSDRRRQLRFRADVWRALCARSRQFRRYGSLADLNNFHKLAYMSPTLHSVELDHLRADGNRGAEAASAHHPFGAQTFGQAVHGHRDGEGARRGRDGDGRHRVRRGVRARQPGRSCRSPTATRRWSGTSPCSMR